MCGKRRFKYLSSLWLADTKWHKTRRETEQRNEDWPRAWDQHRKGGEGCSIAWPKCHFSGRLLVISLLISSNGSNSSVTAGAGPHYPNRKHLQTVPYMLDTTWNFQLALTIIRAKYFCHIHLKYFFRCVGGMCVCTFVCYTCHKHIKVLIQLVEGWTQVVRLGSRFLYLLNPLLHSVWRADNRKQGGNKHAQ